MAWTSPITATTGNVFTAAQFNTDVRDNTNFLNDAPGAKVQASADQPVAYNSWDQRSMGTTVWDTDGIVTGGAGHMIAQTDGVYDMVGQCLFATDQTNRREMRINVNSGTIVARSHDGYPSSSDPCPLAVPGRQQLSAGDTIALELFQNITGGGTLNVLGSSVPVGLSFSIQWVSAG